MRRSIGFLVLARTLTAAQFSGYISDAACGWNNARPGKEARECALRCVKVGWDPVFVIDGKGDALSVSDKAKVMPFVGEHVTITGRVNGKRIDVDRIRPSKPPSKK